MTQPRFVVGIDLGTTHCAVASSPVGYADVQLFEVPQLVAPGEVVARRLLPSFLYLNAESEFAADSLDLPWGPSDGVVGELAQKQGVRAPTRFVASAKSWICHGGVDRRAPILPWSAPEEAQKVSPFEASVRYLAHLRAAWDHAHPDAPLGEQDVVVTVPASFDGAACELTIDAARAAGLPNARLLEEPQAAFYDFLGANEDHLGSLLDGARLVLVVDVGGGTTDLTLVRVHAAVGEAAPEIERIAVGGHLVLGGDNMDAALAHFAQRQGKISRKFDPTEWAALVQSARLAKERLLGAEPPDEAVISIQKRGSRLFGGTQSIRLQRDDVLRELVDGFMPLTAADAVAERRARAGLTTLGLPYATDPAIPRHINSFLRRHASAAVEAGATVVEGLPRPDFVLLNGGVFNAPALVERMQAVFEGWFGAPVPLLDHTALDAAVAQGAARYALSKLGIGQSIGGGTARAYYVGVDDADGKSQAFCVAPRGMEDGASVELTEQVFELLLGQAVRFPLYMYTGDRADAAGAMVVVDDELEPLPALQTTVRADSSIWRDPKTGRVPVRLRSSLTESGTLELSLATVELPPRKWRLEFALSTSLGAAPTPAPDDAPGAASGNTSGQAPEPLPKGFSEACQLVERTFNGGKTGEDVARAKQIRRKLESYIGPRGAWSSAVCRQLLAHLLGVKSHRGRTPKHELAWLRLVGWCLRPGFGAPGDARRIDTLWRVFTEGLAHPKDKALWADWWVLWRRVAPGLDAERQRTIFATVEPWLKGGNAKTGHRPYGHPELLRALATFERLTAEQKTMAAGWFIQRVRKVGSWTPLGRFGARSCFHGELADTVPKSIAEAWLRRLLDEDWSSAEGAAFGAVLIARTVGDSSRDVGEALRADVAARLAAIDAPGSWLSLLTESALSSKDAKRIYGDALPSGLRLG